MSAPKLRSCSPLATATDLDESVDHEPYEHRRDSSLSSRGRGITHAASEQAIVTTSHTALPPASTPGVLIDANRAQFPDASDVVRYRRSESDDGYTWHRMAQTLSHLIGPVLFALKASTLVTLPLCILCFHDKVKDHFPAGSLLAVISTGNTQQLVGEQIDATIAVWQAAAWLMLWGTPMFCLGAPHNEAAHWGFAFAGVIFVSFFGYLRSKRMLMHYGIITMQMQLGPSGDVLLRPAKVAANRIMGCCFAIIQSLLPFLRFVSKQTDRIYAAQWKKAGAIADTLRAGVWLSSTFAGYVMSSRDRCDELADALRTIPAKLFLIQYEPFEGSLWNQLRNVRLTVLQRLLVILNALATSADSLRALTTQHTRDAGAGLVESVQGPMLAYMDALQLTLSKLGDSLDPARTVENCKFEDLMDKKDAAMHAIHDCIGLATCRDLNPGDVSAFYGFIYFHLLLLMLAEELSTLGMQMANFDPSHYKSTWRRFLEFFLLDFWNDFLNEMPGRFLLRTPADRRSLKDGIKLATAYCVAAAFTIHLNDDNSSDTYFYGQAVLFGVGLPTAAESLDIGVQRIAGLAFALAVGYLAHWKTTNFPQSMALLTCLIFVAVCFRQSQRYWHVAYYTSFICPAAYGMATNRITMISRVVDNSFAIIGYFIICNFAFPINPFRVLWNKRSMVSRGTAEAVTQLAAAAALPLGAAR